MIKRHEKCYGISSPAIGRYKIELWFCMPKYKIQPHAHPNIDINLYFVFGRLCKFVKETDKGIVSFVANWPRHFLSKFHLAPNTMHWFEVSNFPLIFLSVEKWNDGIKPTSASEDFKLKQIEKVNNTYA